MPTYTTVNAVRGHKVAGETVNLSGYEDSDISTEIDLVENIIDAYTGTSFDSITSTAYYFDGNGHRSLFFYPLLSIPNVSVSEVLEVDEDDNTLFTFVANTDYHRKDWQINKTWIGRTESRRAFSRSGTVWPTGIRNIKITGDWGYASVPNLVARATILLVLESLMPGSAQLARTGVIEERWDDYRIRRESEEDLTPLDSTGFPKVDMLLETYVFRPDMFLTPQVHAPN